LEQRGIEEIDEEKYLNVRLRPESKDCLNEVLALDAKKKFTGHFIKDMELGELIEEIEEADYDDKYRTTSGYQIKFAQDIFNQLISKQCLQDDESVTDIAKYLTKNNPNIIHDTTKDAYYLNKT
jgi:hypothetical protein